ncbi:MAG TPA: ATP-dependent metallopeptidase FtsH/Yme1/Tma family protein, partial [bacterium]|nr:ATP-dependent metallopeptidase FtsH/Yme1/Tma family protein [bacterium]
MNNNLLKTLTFWAALTAIMLLVLSTVHKAAEPAPLAYSEFLGQAASGNLKDVEVLVRDNGQGYTVNGSKADGSKFTLMAPPNDQSLFDSLRKGGVTMNVKPSEPSMGQMILSVLINWAPMIVLVVFWFILMTRMQGGG